MDLLQHTPALSTAEAAAIARDRYGLQAQASLLPGERDQNFAIDTPAGDRFVLKIANGLESRALLEAQNAALAVVSERTSLCPRVVPSADGALLNEVPVSDGARHVVRLLTWIPGVPLASLVHHSPALLDDLGRRLGEVDRALGGFDHPAIHRDLHWDLARGLDVVREFATLIEPAGVRATVDAVAGRLDADAAGWTSLPRAAGHNDPNDYNVLVAADGRPGERRIVGLLDFGDIVHSFAVADLAIAIAYAVLDKADPLAAAAAIAGGYNAVRPLGDDEIRALHGLVLLRLCASVSI